MRSSNEARSPRILELASPPHSSVLVPRRVAPISSMVLTTLTRRLRAPLLEPCDSTVYRRCHSFGDALA